MILGMSNLIKISHVKSRLCNTLLQLIIQDLTTLSTRSSQKAQIDLSISQ